MGELRAYALGAAELRGIAGASGAWQKHLRTVAQQAFASPARPLSVRDLIGPIYRRVPGQRVLRTDDPTPDDLDVLLAGTPVPPPRAAATWRLIEALVAGLALASTRVPDVDLLAGLLALTAPPVPPVEGLTVGWCPLTEAAAAVPALGDWLGGSSTWAAAALRAGRPTPDVVAFHALA